MTVLLQGLTATRFYALSYLLSDLETGKNFDEISKTVEKMLQITNLAHNKLKFELAFHW